IAQFRKVQELGWVRSRRRNNTGIGKTFEDYVGVVENNIDAYDLHGFEIKSHREESSSYVTLCTKAPSFPHRANAYLLREFGTPYEDNPTMNHLHTSMFADRFNTHSGKYSFRVRNDRQLKEIRIEVYDLSTKKLLNDSCGYTYEALEKIFAKKLKNLFYVSADRKYEGDAEYFNFTQAEIYTEPSFEQFLKLLDQGKIMYDIRMGSYKSGRNIGKPHDHGSGFRILPKDLHLLYAIHEKI
ncbi:MAG: MvaI/BcnI restriction endonuclease family protein, partial [Prevotella sp.]|nr:MvaI/BcnI restriction endonuclease family protein [Prevotella sp.]